MRYSASKQGFYANDINYKSVPEDCVEISQQDYLLLMEGQGNKSKIVPDPDKPGYPKLIPVT